MIVGQTCERRVLRDDAAVQDEVTSGLWHDHYAIRMSFGQVRSISSDWDRSDYLLSI
jgi:hypothetical protein